MYVKKKMHNGTETTQIEQTQPYDKPEISEAHFIYKKTKIMIKRFVI